jgi:hypothetical protein
MISMRWLDRARRTSARIAALAALACAAGIAPTGPAQAADDPRLVIRDPHYGDTLFHFYQSHYFSAVTGLMASQHFGRVSQHADEAEVLRGGLLLSYGLHTEAGAIFARLIDKGAPPAVRDRAWYYLAKIRYQRGLASEAEAALARIEGRLPGELNDDRALLQAQLLMVRGDYAAAAAVLRGLRDSGEASRYARYNLGVALVRSGDTAAGNALLDALGQTPAVDEEQRALRDKANVALGFAALQDNRPQDARAALQRVRLASLQANKALLGFGWAAASMKETKLALVPWSKLMQRDPSDAAVLEARLAVPYAYAELGAYGQALAGYEQAVADYEREQSALDESIAAIRNGKLVQGLLERNPGAEMGWFWSIGELPELPHAAHLTSVLAEHEFQEAFKNYRDLLFLEHNLSDWADRLGAFDDMLANRKQAYGERLPRTREQARGISLPAMRERRVAVAAELARVEAQTDAAALADENELALKQRLERAKATIALMGETPESAEARERLRRAEGALTWRMTDQFPARLWEAKKSLHTIDQQLAEAAGREAALAQAQRDEPARLAGFDGRIAALDGRVKALIPRVAALAGEQRIAVQDIAVAALERQKERLATYATQARFAVAQLYDRAQLAKQDHDGRTD